MRKLKKRDGSWTVTLDLGYEVDPETGRKRRRQHRFIYRGMKADAERELTNVLNQLYGGEFAEPSKITFGRWLHHWLDTTIRPPQKRLRTWESYESIIRVHLRPRLGQIRLQELSAQHLERYYTEAATRKQKPLSQTTLEHHHVIISGALKDAHKKNLVSRNVAKLVSNRPKKAEKEEEEVRRHCWSEEEAVKFLAVAKGWSVHAGAFYSLALDTGARKGELCGLKWENVDLRAGTVAIVRQLIKPGVKPIFGPPKRGKARIIPLGRETARLLQKHKKRQAEFKMKNRRYYREFGLVFAKDWNWGDSWQLGLPLGLNNLGQREFSKIIKAADVKAIKFHGLRHTCATLLLKAGIHPKVVAERLGHKDVAITMNVYSHVLPGMQEEAASKLGSILHQKNV